MTDSVIPLPEPIESVAKHDPYINGKFIELMDRETAGEFTAEMPDFNRALVVGLPVNDPERPSIPVETERVNEFKPTNNSDDPKDAMVSTDEDGDKLNVAYNRKKGAIYIKTSPRGFYLPIHKVPGMIEWLVGRKAKHDGEPGVAA